MGRLIEVNTSEGSILVESTDVSEPASLIKAQEEIIQAGVTEQVEKNLEKMLSVINPFCEALVKNLRSMGDYKPSSASAEFGLSFSGEGNVFFVKVSGEASIKVTLNWTEP